ncbi:MAG: GNAT family N-acetyltransferase [Dehalococcoidia bacterium]|nr:GNAT family N-acetyltransferase [Dehalococcoidia bacterium]
MDNPALDQAMHLAWIRATEFVASVIDEAATTYVGEWFLHDAGVGDINFAMAAVAGDPLQAATELPLVEAWFAARDTPFGYRLRPAHDLAVVACLPSDIREHGRQPYLVSKLQHEPGPSAIPSALEVVEARDAAANQDFDSFDTGSGPASDWSVAARVVAVEECRLWLGYHDGEPAARAMSVATQPVASITNVVVKERFRRRGFGRAISVAAMDACTGAGSDYVCLGSSEAGLPLYLGMGFEQRYELATYRRD